MAYQMLPTQAANISVPAQAMSNQNTIGARLAQDMRRNILLRQQERAREAREREQIGQMGKLRQEDIRLKEEDIERQKEAEDESFWGNLLGGLGKPLATIAATAAAPATGGASSMATPAMNSIGTKSDYGDYGSAHQRAFIRSQL